MNETPGYFTIPKLVTFLSKIQIVGTEDLITQMAGFQFPIISNSATTGHKLQGYTALSLLINNWRYSQNWVYTVLSRVKTRHGLFLRKRIDWKKAKKSIAMNPNLKKMLQKFRERISLTSVEPETYTEMLRRERNHST